MITAQTKTNKDKKAESLAEILFNLGKINQKQYERIRLEQINTGRSYEDIITALTTLSEKDILEGKAKLYDIEFVDLANASISPGALASLPEVVARRFTVFPISIHRQDNSLHLAMADPLDLNAIKFLEKKTGRKVVPYFAAREAILRSMDERYTQSLTTEVSEALKEGGIRQKPVEKPIASPKIGDVIAEAPIAKIVSTILEFAIKSRASDIHVEPHEDKTRIRYRIDGILHEKLTLPQAVHEAVVARIKILCGMKIDEKRIPQDGRFSFRAGDEEVDLRVSSLPIVHGEKIVMRLLKKAAKVPTLPDLGLRGRALKNLQDSILVPHGIILITGPTGSGKTTTLYSILSKINTPQINIITLEDPVEYEIAGINQVQVNPIAGLTFASGLRSFLRQDPNVILVGEIRDKETTELAIQASLTGHLVFSTLHTNSSSGALPRLLDMEAEPFLLASSMTCVVGQRICRRICPSCKEAYEPSSEVVEDIRKVLGTLIKPYEKKGKLMMYRGKKCLRCNQTGYIDRVGIFEVMPVNEKVGRLTMERSPASSIEKVAREEGMITMKQDGYMKVLEGVTTMEEVLRVAQE
jgi:type II secretory ATPase GspE/PulE/Tfp pilus assembly ATPase PilB-like protein